MSSTENLSILKMQDPIVLRAQPVVRKARSQELQVVVNHGPLKVTEVKTVKGETAYMLEARSRMRVSRNMLARLGRKLLAKADPDFNIKKNTRQQRYQRNNRDKVNERARQRYAANREEILARRKLKQLQ